MGLESVLGVTARSTCGKALSHNPRLDCLLYAAGSTLVLWNVQRDTRLYLEGDGHASTISTIAVTSDGTHIASASFEGCGSGSEYESHPTIVVWDVTGSRPGGTYGELHRSRRMSSSDPDCGVVTSMKLAFSPGDRVLASVSVCESATRSSGGKDGGGGGGGGGTTSSTGTLQLCLFDWRDNCRLLQRCTIQGDGEGGERSVHVFAPEHVMGSTDDDAAHRGGGGVGVGGMAHSSTYASMPTFRSTTREEVEQREEAYVCWCSNDRLCVVYGTHVWMLDFHQGGEGLQVVHVRDLGSKLSEKSQRSKKAQKYRQQQQQRGPSLLMGGQHPHAVVGASVCVAYSLLLLISRSGRLLVCEMNTCAVVNSVPPPEDDKEPGSHFTTLSVDGEMTTVGTSSGTLWSLHMRELKWKRPLPFQRQMRARLLGGGGGGGERHQRQRAQRGP